MAYQQSAEYSANLQPIAVLNGKIRRARLAIAVERVWPRLWLPLTVVLVFAIASLAGLWLYLPYRLHIAWLGMFGLAAVASLIPLARLNWPTRNDAISRLEAKSRPPAQADLFARRHAVAGRRRCHIAPAVGHPPLSAAAAVSRH